MCTVTSNSPPNPDSGKNSPQLLDYRLNTNEERANSVWDMSQERAFIETQVNQRFNFFLIFVALVLNAAFNAERDVYFKGILIIGSMISVFLVWPIVRAHLKLDSILRHLKKDDERHPVAFIDKQHAECWSARWVIGWGIPAFAVGILGLMAIGAICGCLPTPKSKEQGATAELRMAVTQLTESVATNAYSASALSKQTQILTTAIEDHQSLESELATLKRKVEELRLRLE